MRRSLFALLVLTSTAQAQLVIFTYDQWERLSVGLQEIYLAGAIDSLSTITTPVCTENLNSHVVVMKSAQDRM